MPTSTSNDHAGGILELHPQGHGFLRDLSSSCEARPEDAYVPADVIRKFSLREGVVLAGNVERNRRPQPQQQNNQRRGSNNNHRRGGPRHFDNNNNSPLGGQSLRLSSVTAIEGGDPDQYRTRPVFDKMTAVDPHQWLNLETTPDRITTRVIDLLTPIGKGQRGLIVAPPRTGKTILIQHLAEAISTNHPEVELIVLLVDERPEEVTDMRRTIRGQVFASSSDRETANHVRLAQLVMERSKRLVEQGKDVIVLLDSITRLARAYNKHVGTTGRTMSGGLDVKALEIPKRLFGTARAFDEGGSLTVMGTALIETGSRMDDVIFQEFKGTGNMELVLDRRLADRRVYPAIDMLQSGTRKEERLLSAESIERITLLRRGLVKMNHIEAMESLINQLKKTQCNNDFLETVSKFLK